MSELSFLIELLLNHDLPKATRDLVASRIKEVEQNIHSNNYAAPQRFPISYPGTVSTQAPSTLALMAKHGDLGHIVNEPRTVEPNVPVPVEHIAQTPAAASALAERNAKINAAMAGRGGNKQRDFKDR